MATNNLSELTPELPDITNLQLVAVKGDRVVIIAPRIHMTRDEALVHAAWLVAMADCLDPAASDPILLRESGIDSQFLAILQAVRNT